jgi:hypothetical protein
MLVSVKVHQIMATSTYSSAPIPSAVKSVKTAANSAWTVFHQTVAPLDIETLRCLVDALATVDKPTALDIEHQLVKSGQPALTLVLEGLSSANPQQQATCAMVLLRWQARQAVVAWGQQHPAQVWIAEQLLALMPEGSTSLVNAPLARSAKTLSLV